MVMLGAVLVFAFAFIKASPAAIASVIRSLGPLIVCLFGLALMIFGRAGIGLPIMMMGGFWMAKNRNVGQISSPTGGQTSTVRSAWLEMQLDHETGDMEGFVLTGKMEGTLLSMMDEETLLALYTDLQSDGDSAQLMEAYLDRRIPLWRENPDAGSNSGQRSATSTGPMTKEEAYQVLGLEPGAGTDAIRAAHRRLMKVVHPDSGGSTFLAARINEAKNTLLE